MYRVPSLQTSLPCSTVVWEEFRTSEAKVARDSPRPRPNNRTWRHTHNKPNMVSSLPYMICVERYVTIQETRIPLFENSQYKELYTKIQTRPNHRHNEWYRFLFITPSSFNAIVLLWSISRTTYQFHIVHDYETNQSCFCWRNDQQPHCLTLLFGHKRFGGRGVCWRVRNS